MDKDELEKYEEDIALEKAKDLFEGGTLTGGQSWRSSLFEAHLNALVGAPLAILAHILLLIWSGIEPNWSNATLFASASWPVFFYLSVSRVFIFRRVFERFHIELEPIAIYKRFKGITSLTSSNGKT